jgi:hypothetical protein
MEVTTSHNGRDGGDHRPQACQLEHEMGKNDRQQYVATKTAAAPVSSARTG